MPLHHPAGAFRREGTAQRGIHWLGGDYGFDASVSRTVAVHSAAIIEALSKVYAAGRLVDEIRAQRPAVAATGRCPHLDHQRP